MYGVENVVSPEFLQFYRSSMESYEKDNEYLEQLKKSKDKINKVKLEIDAYEGKINELNAKRARFNKEIDDEIAILKSGDFEEKTGEIYSRLLRLEREDDDIQETLKFKIKYMKESEKIYGELGYKRKHIEELKNKVETSVVTYKDYIWSMVKKRYYRSKDGTIAGVLEYCANNRPYSIPSTYLQEGTKVINFSEVFLKISQKGITTSQIHDILIDLFTDFFTI